MDQTTTIEVQPSASGSIVVISPNQTTLVVPQNSISVVEVTQQGPPGPIGPIGPPGATQQYATPIINYATPLTGRDPSVALPGNDADMVMPRHFSLNGATPMITWNFPPYGQMGSSNLTSGQIWLLKVPMFRSTLVTSINMYISNSASFATPGANWAGIYSPGKQGQLLATSDITSSLSSGGYKSWNLSTPTVIPGGENNFVYVALLTNANVGPGPANLNSLNINSTSFTGNAWQTRPLQSQLTLPNTIDTTGSLGGSVFWAGLS